MDEQELEAQRALGLMHWYHVNLRLEHPKWEKFKQIKSEIIEAVDEEHARKAIIEVMLKEYPVLRRDQITILSLRLVTFHPLT